MQSKVSFVPSVGGIPIPSNGIVQFTEEIVRELGVSEHQGRSRVQGRRNKKEMGRTYRAMPAGEVYEFGKLIHLHDESEVADYLHHLDGWFRGLKKPKTLGSCIAKVNTFLSKGTHRHLGLILLAQSGNPMARMFLAISRGQLDRESYTDFSLSEAQFVAETIGLVFLFVTIIGLVMNQRKLSEAIYAGRAIAGDAITSINRTGKRVGKTMKQIAITCSDTSDLASKLTSGLSSVQDTCKTVVDWIKSMYSKVKGVLKKASTFVYAFAKMIAMFSIIIIAVELVRTVASFIYKQVLDFISQVFAIPQSVQSWWGPQAQSKKNFLPDFLSGVYEYGFGSPSKVFFELLGPLPKIVSIAKSLEWVYEKFSLVLSAALESWTGELQGKSVLERDIMSFKDRVMAFKEAVAKKSTQQVSSAKMSKEKMDLEVECNRLKAKVVKSQTMRPVYASEFNRYSADLRSAIIQYTSRVEQGGRRPIPVWLYLHGKPGVGKSRMIEPFCAALWATVRSWSARGKEIFEKEKFDLTQLYSLIQEEMFFDGYKNHPIVIVDDMFQSKDATIRNKVATAFINFCSPTPLALFVATPELKNHVFFDSRLIITTSNLAPDFAGENLGLEDVSALRDRINLSVEITADGKYILEQHGTMPRKDVHRELSFEELIAITAECIYTRDSMSMVDPVHKPVPRMPLKYKAARIDVDNSDVFDEGKGKEKVEDEPSQSQSGGKYRLPWWTHVIYSAKEREALAFWKLPRLVRRWLFKRCPYAFFPSVFRIQEDEEIRDEEFVDVENVMVMSYSDWVKSPVFDHFTKEEVVFAREKFPGGVRSVYDLMVLDNGVNDCLMPKLLMGVAALGLVAVGLYALIKVLVPGSAHRAVGEAQTRGYDTMAKGVSKPGKKERAEARRSKAGSAGTRGDRATKFWHRGAQSGSDAVRAAVEQNSQSAEIRVAPKGTPWTVAKDMDPVSSSWALALKGKFWLVPAHLLFAEGEMGEDEIFLSFLRGEQMTWNLTEILSLEMLPGDLAIIELPGIRDRRSIVGHFADSLPAFGSVEHLIPHMSKTIMVAEKAMAWEPALHMTNVNSEYGQFETDLRMHGLVNERGMCGTVYVHQPSSKIIGIHMAGCPSTMTAYATQLFRGDIERLVKGPEIALPMDPELGETQHQAGVQVIGVVDPKLGTYVPPKTNIRRSLFDVSTLPFEESDAMPAMLRPTKVGEEVISPIGNVFRDKFAKQKRVPGAKNLENLDGFLPKSFDQRNVRVIKIEEAIFGIDGYMKPMDRHTSAGYFYKKMGLNRAKLFGPNPKDNGGKIEIHPILRKSVEHKMEQYRKGIIVPVVFEMFLKDEVRERKKAIAGNTRPVDPMDLDSLIIQRMVLGTFIEESMKDPVHAPVALSINPHSSEWGALWARHHGHDRKVGAGDFTTYDFSVKNECKEDYIRLVKMYHPEPDLCYVVIEANFQGWHICGILVFFRCWGTSSGSLITGHFNCFCNWWIHKSAFLTVYPESEWHRVFTSFVGDDSIFSKDKELERFTMETISRFCREVMGMEYTSPWKDQTMTVDWDSLVFLKRKFVNTPRGMMGPLAEHSLSNMVKWCECDPRDEEVMQSTLQSLLVECWHYGEEKYNEVYQWARSECRRLGVNACLPDWTSMKMSRRRDYNPGICTLDYYEEGDDPLVMLVCNLNIRNIQTWGAPETVTYLGPLVEEIARTCEPKKFSDNIAFSETRDKQKVADMIGDLNPTAAKMVMSLANLGAWFHDLMGGIAEEGVSTLFDRFVAHSRWNHFMMYWAEHIQDKMPWRWIFETIENYHSMKFIRKQLLRVIGESAVLSETLKLGGRTVSTRELEDSWEMGLPVNRRDLASSMAINCVPLAFSCALGVFNATMNDEKSTVTTATTADNGVQAVSEQSLTAPAATALFVTPTMTFGDVGQVAEQELGGYAERAHGVGEFEDTLLLERMVLVNKLTWTVDDNTFNIYKLDLDAFLREYVRNANVLQMFYFYRSDIELTIKLNTNQFYYGALMVTIIPGNGTGDSASERAIIDPTVISAQNADSVIKTWTWMWPYPWRGLAGFDEPEHPVWLYVDQLAKLGIAKADMPGSLTISIWARFKNIRLAYPHGASSEAQSGRPKVAVPMTRRVSHPADDPLGGLKAASTSVLDAVTSIPATIVDGAVGALTSTIDTGLGALIGAVLDKPDQVDEQKPMIIEGSKDLFAADIADTNVCLSLNKARYVDPSPSRMPMSKDWTLADYAKIPGLRAIDYITGAGGGFSTKDIQLVKPICPGDEPRTPLDYAVKCAALWRGSVKVMIMFFCSSFVSARFSVQVARSYDPPVFDTDYDNGISRVINVKGDTVDCFVVPWLDPAWWREIDLRWIRLKLQSTIATSDTTTTPRISFVMWVSGGDDIQFQFPRVPQQDEWPEPEAESEAQSSIGKMFEGEFPPIVDNVVYDTDNGFATGETIGLMTDVAKRYSCLNATSIANYQPLAWHAEVMDKHPTLGPSQDYAQYVAWRRTFFGAMRACFYFRSGGYRYRQYKYNTGDALYSAALSVSAERGLNGTTYPEPFDRISRITVPQVSTRPFYMFDDFSGDLPEMTLNLTNTLAAAPGYLQYVAARDDVQFGFPILPTGVPLPDAGALEKEDVKPDLRKTSVNVPLRRQ